MKHGTPTAVVKLLAKHIPTNCRSVLEPAVGIGALLKPFASKRFLKLEKITAIDISAERVSVCRNDSETSELPISYVEHDFLAWDTNDTFDCIVMNPPFNAKKRDFVEYKGKTQSVEAAFIEKAMDLLGDEGVMIAIVPSSIISSVSLTALRENILNSFSIKKVYELNKFSFPGIEGRFYVLVAKKSGRSREVVLEKPFSKKTVSIKLDSAFLADVGYRLDFSYHFSLVKLDHVIQESGLAFEKLKDVVSFDRGKISAPYIHEAVLHTSNYLDGEWVSKNIEDNLSRIVTACSGDILVKRVSRNCHESFGLFDGFTTDLSDCLLRMRPREELCGLELLFSIRTMYSSSIGRQILVKGTGADYITTEALGNARVPMDLHVRFNEDFAMYKLMHLEKNHEAKKRIERSVLERLVS